MLRTELGIFPLLHVRVIHSISSMFTTILVASCLWT